MHLAIYYYGAFGGEAPATLILGAYDLSNKYHRISEEEKLKQKDNFSDEKWEFTPQEIAQAFNCNYVPEAKFSFLVHSNINNEGITDKIYMIEEDVLSYDLFLDDPDFNVSNWLLNNFWVDYFTCCRINENINNAERKYVSYSVEYNYGTNSDVIINNMKMVLHQ